MNENGFNNQYGTPMNVPQKVNRPFYQKWWFWLIVAIVAIVIFAPREESTSSGTDNTSRVENTAKVIPSAEPTVEVVEEPFDISKCEEIAYKEYARHSDNYIGNAVQVKVKIAQVLESGFTTKTRYYRCYPYRTDEGNEDRVDYDNMYIIYDRRGSGSEKILEDDTIIAYGTFNGLEQVTLALGGTNKEVLSIDMIDSVLISE